LTSPLDHVRIDPAVSQPDSQLFEIVDVEHLEPALLGRAACVFLIRPHVRAG